MSLLAEEEALPKVHPHRFRLWGLASSPGGGCIAALVSKHVTQHAERRPRSRVMFSWDTNDQQGPDVQHTQQLTTEGTLWEAMYGQMLEMPSFLSGTTDTALFHETPLRKMFKTVIPRQQCVFCATGLVSFGNESICEKGHPFGELPFFDALLFRGLMCA
jgi:hypothetical protein